MLRGADNELKCAVSFGSRLAELLLPQVSPSLYLPHAANGLRHAAAVL